MDLQMYYQKIREIEDKIADEFPLMVSVETPDGGKGGTKTEVPRRLAAKLMVDGQARPATKEELKAYREALAEAKRLAETGGGGGEAAVDGAVQRRSLTGCGARRGVTKSRRHTMALFTDGAISSIEDLTGHDTQLLNVANVEGIDVTRKLALAQEELGVEVAGLLGRRCYRATGAPPAIEQVVVTPPLKLWHVFRTLEMVYRDAYHSQLNDRYAGKRDEYREMAKWALRPGYSERAGNRGGPGGAGGYAGRAAGGGRPGGRHLLRGRRMDERGG